MRITKDRAAENRARVVDAAAKLFREKGFEAVGVADLMHAAGLTHGRGGAAPPSDRSYPTAVGVWRGACDAQP